MPMALGADRVELNIVTILERLARTRPIFHSEADFQHALAWQIHELHPGSAVRLEYRPRTTSRMSIDIWAQLPAIVAIELKYLVRRFAGRFGGEDFDLLDQAAHDIRRYDFIKDIARLESVVAEVPNAVGYAVLLTNDSSHWRQSQRDDTADALFRIHDGHRLSGERKWGTTAGEGTMQGRKDVLKLTGAYDLSWRDYSTIDNTPGGRFRSLVVRVT